MRAYRKVRTTSDTYQNIPIPGKKQVKNNAGGYVFELDKWKQLERFLIMGSEGGTYYVGEQKLTRDNADNVIKCIRENGVRVVEIVRIISIEGRAYKNDPALFVLAMCTSVEFADENTRKVAFAALPQTARIGTHLFHFITFREQFGGWGKGMKKAIANWYLHKNIDTLAYQVIKYPQRDGWSHRDAIRLAHPKTDDKEMNMLMKYITNPLSVPVRSRKLLPHIVKGYEDLKQATDLKKQLDYIATYRLPREVISCVDNKLLTNPEVWKVLLKSMPLTAMIRNLGNMTRIEAVKPLSRELDIICKELRSEDQIKKSRVHPIQMLAAMLTYSSGHGGRSTSAWNPISQIVDSLDDGFYKSFKNIEPTGRRILVGLDVSGSMGFRNLQNIPGLTPRSAAAALCLATAKSESIYHIMGFSDSFIPLAISPRMRLDDVIRITNNLPFNRTDCALPMTYALEKRIEVDAFVVYTDNETWCGTTHPVQALQEYRRKMGIPAKLIVVAMEGNNFSIADPSDAGMLDVVGFDSATPQLISNFIKE